MAFAHGRLFATGSPSENVVHHHKATCHATICHHAYPWADCSGDAWVYTPCIPLGTLAGTTHSRSEVQHSRTREFTHMFVSLSRLFISNVCTPRGTVHHVHLCGGSTCPLHGGTGSAPMCMPTCQPITKQHVSKPAQYLLFFPPPSTATTPGSPE